VVCTNLLDSGPTTDLVGGTVPNCDGTYVTARYFRERTIEANGFVKQSTLALLEAIPDTMRESRSGREGNLDLTDNNGTSKRFVATCVNLEELFADRRAYHQTFCPFRARFLCRTPFAKSRDYTTEPYYAVTTSPQNQSLVNEGTYKTLLTVILTRPARNS
jgi:hypothetical protein